MLVVSAADWWWLFPDNCVWLGKIRLYALLILHLMFAYCAIWCLNFVLLLQFALSAVLSIARSIGSRGKRDDFDDFN